MRYTRLIALVAVLQLMGGVLFAQGDSVSLSDLFRMADESNRYLKILNNSQQIAKEGIEAEKKNLLPDISTALNLSYNGDGYITDRNFSNGFSVPIPKFRNNFVLEAKQLLYAGGAVKTGITMAETNYAISQLETETNRQQLRFGITAFYLEILKLKNHRHILVKNIEQADKLIAQIESRNKEGVALKNNVTRYELQKQSLEVALLQVDNASKIVEKELLRILNAPEGTELNITANVDQLLTEVNEGGDWGIISSQHAPDLKLNSLRALQASRAITLAKSAKFPQVYAFAGNYLNGPVMIEIPVLNNNFNYWNIGAGIRYNISSLYKSKSKINQATIDYESALEGERVAKDKLRTDLESAEIRLNESKAVYATHLKGMELASQNYTIIRNRYVNDMALTTEMLDAENTQLDASLKAANSKINILFQFYQLKKLAGTL